MLASQFNWAATLCFEYNNFVFDQTHNISPPQNHHHVSFSNTQHLSSKVSEVFHFDFAGVIRALEATKVHQHFGYLQKRNQAVFTKPLIVRYKDWSRATWLLDNCFDFRFASSMLWSQAPATNTPKFFVAAKLHISSRTRCDAGLIGGWTFRVTTKFQTILI